MIERDGCIFVGVVFVIVFFPYFVFGPACVFFYLQYCFELRSLVFGQVITSQCDFEQLFEKLLGNGGGKRKRTYWKNLYQWWIQQRLYKIDHETTAKFHPKGGIGEEE